MSIQQVLDDTHSCQELLIVNAIYQPFLLLPTPGISVMAPALKITGGHWSMTLGDV